MKKSSAIQLSSSDCHLKSKKPRESSVINQSNTGKLKKQTTAIKTNIDVSQNNIFNGNPIPSCSSTFYSKSSRENTSTSPFFEDQPINLSDDFKGKIYELNQKINTINNRVNSTIDELEQKDLKFEAISETLYNQIQEKDIILTELKSKNCENENKIKQLSEEIRIISMRNHDLKAEVYRLNKESKEEKKTKPGDSLELSSSLEPSENPCNLLLIPSMNEGLEELKTATLKLLEKFLPITKENLASSPQNELINELTSSISLFQVYLNSLVSEKELLLKDMQMLEIKCRKVEKCKSDIENENNKLKNTLDQKLQDLDEQQRIKSNIENENNELKDTIKNQLKENNELKDTIKNQLKENNDLKDTIKNHLKELDEKIQTISRIDTENNDLKYKIDKILKELDNLNQLKSFIVQANKDLEVNIENYRKEISKKDETISSIEKNALNKRSNLVKNFRFKKKNFRNL